MAAGDVLLPAAAALTVAAPEVGAAAAATEGVATIVPLAEAAVIAPAAEGVAAIAPIVEEAEALTPFAHRYLNTSGGRLGNTTTRQQLHDIAQDLAQTGKYPKIEGDGHTGEEFIRGAGPGTKGGTFVDLTAKATDGSTVRVQTVNTLANGRTPTSSEAAAAARIRAAFPNDRLWLIPKRVK